MSGPGAGRWSRSGGCGAARSSELFATGAEGDELHLFDGSLEGPVAKGSIELAGTLGEAEPHREAKVELAEHLKSKRGKITVH